MLLVGKLDFNQTLLIKDKLGEGKMLEHEDLESYKYLKQEFGDSVLFHYQPYFDAVGGKTFKNIYSPEVNSFLIKPLRFNSKW